MDDTLKLALRISAVDLFSGVLRRFKSEIVGTGKEAEAMQRRYESMVGHMQAGLKALAVAGYGFEKLKPAVGAAMDMQTAIANVGMILQRNTGITAKYNAELKALADNAYAITNATKGGLQFPAYQVMNVQAQLLQAGTPLAAIMDSTDKAGRTHHGAAYMIELLAETKHKDPADMAQAIEKIAHSFQIAPDQYGNIANIIAKTSVLGSGSLDELLYNLDQAGAVAHNMGHMSLQQSAIVMKDLSPYGESAGSEFNTFVMALMGARFRGAKWMEKSGLNFYDKQGNFIGLDPALMQISNKYGAGKVTEKAFNERLGRAFGPAGIKVLDMLLAPSAPGVKSYPEMKAAFQKQAGLVAQNEIVSGTQAFQSTKFMSALNNLGSTAFMPLVKATTKATHAMTGLATGAASFAQKHPAFDKALSGGAAVGLAGIAAYGGYRLLRGGIAGAPFLKRFLRGAGGDVAGIAEGKLVEQVAGITPVFVTNWPATLPFGPGATPLGAPKGAAAEAESAAATAAGTAEKAAATTAKAETVAAEATTTSGRAIRIASEGLHVAGMGARLKGLLGAFSGLAWAPMLADPAGAKKHIDAIAAQDLAAEKRDGGYWKSWETVFSSKAWRKALGNGGHRDDAVKLDGSLTVKIDQDNHAKVTGLHINQPGVSLNVGYLGLVP